MEESKNKLFEVMDRIDKLENSFIELSSEEELELRNLKVKMKLLYSDWKD